MHFVHFLFILFYVFYSTCSGKTLERTNDEKLLVKPLQLTVTPKPTATDMNTSKNSGGKNQLGSDLELFQKPNNKKICNDDLLNKILYMILENKDIGLKACNNVVRDDKDVKKSDLDDLIEAINLGLDYYDDIEKDEARQIKNNIPVSIESPKNGLLGRLHFKFEPMDNNNNNNNNNNKYNYRREGKKQGRNRKEKHPIKL